MERLDPQLRAPLMEIVQLSLARSSKPSRGGKLDLRGYARLLAEQESIIFVFLRGEVSELTAGNTSVRRVSPRALKRPTVGAILFATCPSTTPEGLVTSGSTELFPFAVVAAYAGYIPQQFK